MPLKNEKKPENSYKHYAFYSGIAFQMLGIIAVGTYLGHFLSSWLNVSHHYITAAFALVSVLLAVFLSVKQIIDYSNKNQ